MDKHKDHNDERGWVHPDLAGRYAYGYRDPDTDQFVTLWTANERWGSELEWTKVRDPKT